MRLHQDDGCGIQVFTHTKIEKCPLFSGTHKVAWLYKKSYKIIEAYNPGYAWYYLLELREDLAKRKCLWAPDDSKTHTSTLSAMK